MTRLAVFCACLFPILMMPSTVMADDRLYPVLDDPHAELVRLERAIQQNPEDMTARLDLARVLVQFGDYDRAEKMAEVVGRRTASETAALVRADALLRAGRLDDAFDVIERRTDLSSDGKALRAVIVAEQALSQGHPDSALDALAPAAGHETFGSFAKIAAARAYYLQGQLADARRLAEEIVADGAAGTTARLFRAQLALEIGDTYAARALANEILDEQPGNISAGAIAVQALLREDRVAAARKMLPALRPEGADDPRPAYLEGLVLVREGRIREASLVLAGIEEWLAIDSAGALFLSDIKNRMGLTAQAEAVLRKRLNANPGDIAVIRELTKILDATGRPDQAADLVDRSLSLLPGHPELVRLQTDRLVANGELDGVAGLDVDGPTFTESAAVGGNLGGEAAMAARMDALVRTGNAAAAVELAEDQGAMGPVARNALASALAATGEREQAAAVLEELIAAYPDYLDAIRRRAELEGTEDAFLRWLIQAKREGATSAVVFRHLAKEQYVSGDMAAALRAARTAATAADAAPEDRLIVARLLIAEGRSEEAAGHLSSLEEAIPASAIDRASLLMAAGADDAAADLAAGVPVPLDDADAALQLATILEDGGRIAAARQALTTARSYYPDNLAVWRANIELLAREDVTEARALLGSLDGISAERRIIIEAHMLRAAGRTAEALLLLGEADGSMPVFAAMADIGRGDEDRQALLVRLRDYRDNHPADTRILVLMGGVALGLGQTAEAEEVLSAALAAAPGNPGVLNNLALARLEAAPQEARRLARRAFEAAPGNPAIAETYASILASTGNNQLAGRIARRALINNPGDAALQEYREFGRSPA